MHSLGVNFLNSILELHGKKIKPPYTIEIRPQFMRIDIFVLLEYEGGRFAVIIEDKTNSREGKNQLVNYYNKIRRQGYKNEEILSIYFKTGFQHDLSKVREAEFQHYNVSRFLDVLHEGIEQKIKSDLFSDIYNYYISLNDKYIEDEQAFHRFHEFPLGSWGWWHWHGFFHYYSQKTDSNWGVVGNNREPLVALWSTIKEMELEVNGNEYRFQLYFDIQFSGYGKFRVGCRLSLGGIELNNVKVRNAFAERGQQKLKYHHIYSERMVFRKATSTLGLLHITNIDKSWYSDELSEFLQSLRLVLHQA